VTVQEISPLSAGFSDASGVMTGKNSGDTSASFADLLASVSAEDGSPPSPQEIQAAAAAHMMQRIAQVGFVQFAAEQQQEAKMMRVLGLLEAGSPPDEQSVLQGIQDDFARNPPNGLQDMYARIDKIVSAIPPSVDNDLHGRMAIVVKEIRQMMDEPDNALAQRAQADGLNLTSVEQTP
jgi:hypothetical protein